DGDLVVVVGHVLGKPLDAQRVRSEQVGGRTAVVGAAVPSEVQRVDLGRADCVGVAPGDGVGLVLVAGAAGGQRVGAVEERQRRVVVNVPAREHLVLIALVVVDAAVNLP